MYVACVSLQQNGLDAIKGAAAMSDEIKGAAMPDEIRDYFIRSNVFLRITSEEIKSQVQSLKSDVKDLTTHMTRILEILKR